MKDAAGRFISPTLERYELEPVREMQRIVREQAIALALAGTPLPIGFEPREEKRSA